ncbi:MAG TPA: hypothetical protein VKW78_13030 [Terriglobales bacterium]|nr:hypothetical protein [Terriglobales bacterium]
MELFDAGLGLYQLNFVLNIWLLGLLWRADRKHYFLAYTAFRLIATMVRFPALLAGGMDTYTKVYWLTSGILIFACVWILCDFFPKLTVPISIAAVALSFMQLLHPSVALERNVQIAMFVASCYVLILDRRNFVAAGLAIATLLPAVGEWQAVLLGGTAMRFVPSLAFLLAQAVWIFGIFKQRQERVMPHGYIERHVVS